MLSGLEQEFWLDHICTFSKKLNRSVALFNFLICKMGNSTSVVKIK